MTVRIDEISTVIEPQPGGPKGSSTAMQAGEPPPYEVRLEELRPLVRALVAEEIERWLRMRSEGP